MKSHPAILYKAPWVVPILTPVVRDGGVLVRGNRIAAVGRFSELSREADRIVDINGAILPRLINCHAHLELSIHGSRVKYFLDQGGARSFPDWIRSLLASRQEGTATEDVLASARQLLRKMGSEGIGFVLDTGNMTTSAAIGEGEAIEVLFLLEMLGMTETAAVERGGQLESLESHMWVTGHAPYSTHPVLLQRLKKHCHKAKRLFSIHTAESREEAEFLQNGAGDFFDFLKERGAWDGSFSAPGLSPVAYLGRLGLLDKKTLCVHCVQVDGPDIDMLAASGAQVCLCPESNRTLGVGRAPAEKLLAAGIAFCLGTDSLTSNPHCSLWQEMGLLSEEHPGLAPSVVLAAATLNGARAIGLEARMGALAPGREAKMIAVEQDCRSAAQLLSHLASIGGKVRLQQIGEAHG